MLTIWIPESQAATLTTARDYLTRQAENLQSGEIHEIQFTPATAVSGGAGLNKIIVVFPDGDDGTWCATAGTDLTESVAGLKDSATALPGTTLAAKCVKGTGASSYDTITIEGVDDLTAGTTYAVKVSDGSIGKLGTPANTTTGFIIVQTNNGSGTVDERPILVDILTTDQISVSAHVEPTITFAITDTSLGFGAIPLASVRYATEDGTEAGGSNSVPADHNPTQLQLSTNAQDGAVIEIKDTNTVAGSGLYDVASTTTLTSRASTVVAAGTAGFGIYGKHNGATTGTLDIAEAFDNDTTSDLAIGTAFQTFASSTAPLDTATVDVVPIAAISSVTPAGSYADTLTIVATGKF
ncbi:MAG: hypothetical protein V1804_00065 [Patescibacteria group bacterium]